MNLKQYYLTNNDCYKEAAPHLVKGIMVHSTGANNPWLSRVIAPDDGLVGPNFGGNHWNQSGLDTCVHAFIGKLASDEVATYNTLPWVWRAWHSGTGDLGYKRNANNNGFIGFEIMEDGLIDPVYFCKVYKEATELCAYLCRMFGLAPDDIICHSEGVARGIASNHADVMHWFPRHGKNMVIFREDVAELLKPEEEEEMERYQTIDEVPDYARETVQWLIDIGQLTGTDKGLDITLDMIRGWIITFGAISKMKLTK